jgi:hypothetical protein
VGPPAADGIEVSMSGTATRGASRRLVESLAGLRHVAELRPQGRVVRVGTVRIPLGGPYRPLATLYRLPDGRLLWLVRLWEIDRPQPRLLPTSTLLAFCRHQRLPQLRAEILDCVSRARPGGP